MPVASPPTLFTASGVWQDNLPHGEGKFIWATGEVLACKWRAGRPLSDNIVSPPPPLVLVGHAASLTPH